MSTHTEPTPALEAGEHYAAARLGPLSKLMQYSTAMPDGSRFPGKIWLKQLLGLSGLEISIGAMAPGQQVPFVHAHRQNEELYVFLSGRGEMSVDDAVIPVEAGTVLRVDPAGARCWRNTGQEELVYAVIQAKAGSLEQWTGEDGFQPGNQTPAWAR